MFRLVEKHHGTLVIDEGDFRESDAYSEIVKILNCGYTKGLPVLRSEGNNGSFEVRDFECYGPKIIATRGKWHDQALESRCLTIETKGRSRSDVPINLDQTMFNTEALILRNKLLLWRLRNYHKVVLNNEAIDSSVEDRINQIMVPLASVIKDKGGLTNLQKFIRDYDQELKNDRGMTYEAELFEIIARRAEAQDSLSIKEIAADYNLTHIPDKLMTPRKAGGIIRKRLHLQTERTRDGYVVKPGQDELQRLKARYGLDNHEKIEVDNPIVNAALRIFDGKIISVTEPTNL